MFWGSCGSQLKSFAICILGSLDVVPGESSTQTLFLRVMDTFDDDDDEQQHQQQQQWHLMYQDIKSTNNVNVKVAGGALL